MSFSSKRSDTSELRLTHLYLSIFYSCFEARLWMYRRSVDHPAIVQRKPRIMIWTNDSISDQLAFRQWSAEMRTRLCQSKNSLSLADQNNRSSMVLGARRFRILQPCLRNFFLRKIRDDANSAAPVRFSMP